MKIYVHDPKDENCFIDCPSASVSCTKAELNILVDGLIEFRTKIENYVKNNPDELDYGESHMHYRFINEISEKSDVDLIFIVDVNTAKNDDGTVI